MQFRQLEIFIAAAETENMTAAARKLYISQPAVSQAILELEQELGLSLFDRKGKAIFLNQSGQLFYQQSQQLVKEFYQLQTFSGTLAQRPLKIGVNITIANLWLPLILQQLTAQGVRYQVTIDTAETIMAALRNRQLDAALIEGPVEGDVVREVFGAYECVVIAPFTSEWRNQDISTETFVKAPLLLRDSNSAIRRTLDSWLLLHHFSAEPVLTSINSQALITAVKAELGLSFLPLRLVQREAVKILRFQEGRLFNEVQLVTLDSPETEPLQKLQAIIRAIDNSGAAFDPTS